MKTYKSTMKKFELKPTPSDFPKVKITCSADAYNVIKQFYHEDIEIYESFFILLLNRANNTVGYVKISQGGVSGTVVDPKLIAKYIADTLASGVILAHNHPSGNLKPSQSDKQMTRKIQQVAEILNSKVLDHIILSPEGTYYSFGDNCDL